MTPSLSLSAYYGSRKRRDKAAAGRSRMDRSPGVSIVYGLTWNNAVVDLVTAGVLLISDQLAGPDILLLGEDLHPPYLRGRGRRVGDLVSCRSARRGKTERTTKERTPRQVRRPLFPRLKPARSGISRRLPLLA